MIKILKTLLLELLSLCKANFGSLLICLALIISTTLVTGKRWYQHKKIDAEWVLIDAYKTTSSTQYFLLNTKTGRISSSWENIQKYSNSLLYESEK